MKKKYDFNLNMIILIIVIVVIFIVGGVYMFNSSSKADKNQEATSGDYDTQTYHTKSNPIKFDANKEPKQVTHNGSPAPAILRNFLKNNSSSKADNKKAPSGDNDTQPPHPPAPQPPHPPAPQPPYPPAPQPPYNSMSHAHAIRNSLKNNSSNNSVKALIPFYRSSSKPLGDKK